MFLSLVIPIFNEAASLPELIARCLKVCRELGHPFEILLVDDGSRDGSQHLIEVAANTHQGEIFGVLLNRNYGQHAAVMAGFAESCGEVVVTLDGDLQNPPEEIPKLLCEIDAGADVVGSVRAYRRDNSLRRWGSKAVNWLVRRLTGSTMLDYGCMLRAYRRPIVEAMLACRESSTFIPILADTFAGTTAQVTVAHAQRQNDESRYTLLRLLNLHFDLITSTTTLPLRLLSILGSGVAAIGFGFGLLLMFVRLVYGAAWAGEGVFTIFAVAFFLMGVQLLGLGLLGEYVGRIYADVRARPRYFVRRRVGDKQFFTKTFETNRNVALHG